jgi:hypothetical protein
MQNVTDILPIVSLSVTFVRGDWSLSKRIKKVLEAVGFNDVNGLKLFAEFPGREAFLFKPNDVGLWEVDQQPAFMFTERHPGLGELHHKFRVGGEFLHGGLLKVEG